MFYQLFGLSFWRHPFTAEDPLVSKWCNATFLQIYSDEETIFSISTSTGLPEGEYIFNKIHFWEKDFKMYKTWAVYRHDSCSQHKLCYCLNTRKESERERLAVSVWALAIWPRLLWHLLDPREQLKEKRHLTSDVLESTGFTISNTACFSMLFAKSILASHLSDCREVLKRAFHCCDHILHIKSTWDVLHKSSMFAHGKTNYFPHNKAAEFC